jgi:hypothetical protein
MWDWETHLAQTLRGLICGAALCLSACGSTTFISTWKAPDAQRVDPVGKNIVALVISSDADRRRDAEVYLANDLTTRGARGIAAYTMIGLDHPTADYACARFKEAGMDGVVVMRLVGKDQQVIVDPGGFSGSVYGSFGSYYSAYGMAVRGTSRTSNPEGLQELVYEVADAVASQVVKQGLVVR